jgi:hypothetical protein
MSGSSRYDRAHPVEPEHLAEAQAFHLIAHLLDDYPGITNSAVAGMVGHVLHTAANELSNGRALPLHLRTPSAAWPTRYARTCSRHRTTFTAMCNRRP